MARSAAVNQGVVLPPPAEKYDAANERETRRLLEEALRRLMQWGTVTDVPKNVVQLANLTGAADKVPYFTSVSAMALASLTPYARTLIACIDAATVRTTLGLGALAVLNAVTEGTITLADVATLNVSSALHGFAPKSPADATMFLNGAATPAFAAVKDSDLALTDITTNNVSTTKHGFTPKLANDATKYLDGSGAWSVPTGSGATVPVFPTLSIAPRLRLSARYSTITKSQGLVTGVTDISGNSHHATSTSNIFVRYLAKGFNDGVAPALAFDGFSRLVVAGLGAIAAPWSVVMVTQNIAVANGDGNIYRDDVPGPCGYLPSSTWGLFAGTAFTTGAPYAQMQNVLPNIGPAVSLPHVRIDVANGASSLMSNNGVDTTGNAGSGALTTSSSTLYIGGIKSSLGTSNVKMLLYEFLVFPGALTLADRTALNTYYSSSGIAGIEV